jgi:hypothetical protein
MASSAERFRDHPFLAAVVAAARGRPFLPAAALPRWTVPPRYDVLLRTRAYDQIGPMISVDVVVQEYPVSDCRVIE